ncbi:phosphoglycerate mutase family protein [Tatumella sp. UBA2305]|uniref:phosphoglycerate mutase family protein n=1 Tax=Tatumella sp. UBA2305 TaxID=1947647 RepID=UPI0025DD9202|nr:phosphoglycerate mutase family protein [Tatumella sp. UBA2305]
MKIILMRHGKPAFTSAKKISSSAMAEWIKQYDLSDTGDDKPPESCLELVNRPLKTLSSPLPRAVSSASKLKRLPEMTCELFREAELPVLSVPLLKLSPSHWAVIFRVLWLCGLSPNSESLSMAKARAKQAAQLLIDTSTEHNQSVLLAGHGIINRLIARELISQGWTESSRGGKGYWGAAVFESPRGD